MLLVASPILLYGCLLNVLLSLFLAEPPRGQVRKALDYAPQVYGWLVPCILLDTSDIVARPCGTLVVETVRASACGGAGHARVFAYKRDINRVPCLCS